MLKGVIGWKENSGRRKWQIEKTHQKVWRKTKRNGEKAGGQGRRIGFNAAKILTSKP